MNTLRSELAGQVTHNKQLRQKVHKAREHFQTRLARTSKAHKTTITNLQRDVELLQMASDRKTKRIHQLRRMLLTYGMYDAVMADDALDLELLVRDRGG